MCNFNKKKSVFLQNVWEKNVLFSELLYHKTALYLLVELRFFFFLQTVWEKNVLFSELLCHKYCTIYFG